MRSKAVRCAAVLLMVALLAGCGNPLVVNGKNRGTIGLVNMIVADSSIMEPKYPDVQYRIIWGNVVWGVILSETVVFPVYFFGFSMFEPVGPKTVALGGAA